MKIAAFSRQSGYIQAHGDTKSEVMSILGQIGFCLETIDTDLEWLKITDRLAAAVDALGCDAVKMEKVGGIVDIAAEDEFD